LFLVSSLGGCATYEYEAAPIDTSQILSSLQGRRWHDDLGAASVSSDGPRPRQLVAFAVMHNPWLVSARTQIGVAKSLLLEAGLLANPQIGWGAMDAIASQVIDSDHSTLDVATGLGFSMTLPRPGELDAKEGAARWRVEEARRQLSLAEWILARDVLVACENVFEAERLLLQNDDVIELADATREYFERARSAGAATAIQANLAAGDLLTIRSLRLSLTSRLREARQSLNSLLGLPPNVEVGVVAGDPPAEFLAETEDEGLDAVVDRALSLRPDLAVLLASYQAAEDDLRLAIARQAPQFAVGTGLWITPGLFTENNRRAVETAMARRAELRADVEAAVHELRRDLFDTYAEREEAKQQLGFLEQELLPNAEESLRLAGEAFDAGEVTPLEILILQRVLVDARTATTESRAELQRRNLRLLAASGGLLSAPSTETEPTLVKELDR